MSLWQLLFGEAQPRPKGRTSGWTFQPEVEPLEDRTALSAVSIVQRPGVLDARHDVHPEGAKKPPLRIIRLQITVQAGQRVDLPTLWNKGKTDVEFLSDEKFHGLKGIAARGKPSKGLEIGPIVHDGAKTGLWYKRSVNGRLDHNGFIIGNCPSGQDERSGHWYKVFQIGKGKPRLVAMVDVDLNVICPKAGQPPVPTTITVVSDESLKNTNVLLPGNPGTQIAAFLAHGDVPTNKKVTKVTLVGTGVQSVSSARIRRQDSTGQPIDVNGNPVGTDGGWLPVTVELGSSVTFNFRGADGRLLVSVNAVGWLEVETVANGQFIFTHVAMEQGV